jgi:thymidylate synthase (FAD)
MQYIIPKIFHIGTPSIDRIGLNSFLEEIGASDWQTNASSDQEEIIEVMGRLCYRSYAVGLNPNITRIRDGNDVYIGNILDSNHGSVTTHGMESYIIHNVSRIFTHELVRHKAGTEFSQESMRYVRIDELKFWFPKCFEDHPKRDELKVLSDEALIYLESLQHKFTEILDVENIKSFDQKKLYTSAMRRWAPDGLGTSIGLSINQRAARWIIQMRTNRHSEEEIRLVFGMIYQDLKSRYPNLYQDSNEELVKGLPEITFKNPKI